MFVHRLEALLCRAERAAQQRDEHPSKPLSLFKPRPAGGPLQTEGVLPIEKAIDEDFALPAKFALWFDDEHCRIERHRSFARRLDTHFQLLTAS